MRNGNFWDSGIDLVKVGIPKLNADSRIDQIGCSILEFTVRQGENGAHCGYLMLFLYIWRKFGATLFWIICQN